MENRFLKEALNIADRLISLSKDTETGKCWETLQYNEGVTSWKVSDSIYSGTSGIVYFLLEVYEATKDKKYLDASKSGLEWLWQTHQTDDTDYYAFFTGRSGLAYVFLKAHELTQNEDYKSRAIQIMLDCEDKVEQGSFIDDLINGFAGTLLLLLYGHSYTQDDRIIPIIEKYADMLIERGVFGQEGIYWDRAITQKRGLCGFSHGTAGIGYVFLQLGAYFKNENYYFLGEMAFAYENQFFNEEGLNWPDFRKGFYDEKSLKEFKEKYAEDDFEFFKSSGLMKAWCHGSPGIGLSRVSAYKLLGDKYFEDLKKSVLSTIQSIQVNEEHNYHSYTLCHGVGGNSLLLMEAKDLLPDIKIAEELEIAGDKAIAQYKDQGFYTPGLSMHKDGGGTSLFMGDAGVGYFLLALSQGFTKTILKPEVTGNYTNLSDNSVLSISKENLIDRLGKKAYPESWEHVNKKMDLSELNPENLYGQLGELIDKNIPEEHKPLLKLDSVKNDLDAPELGNAYIHIRQMVESERIINALEDNKDISDLKVYLPKEHKLHELSDEEHRLLIGTSEGVISHDLNFFTYLIMSKFEEVNTVNQVIKSIMEEFEVEDEQQVVDTVTEQARQALNSGILFLAK